MSPKLDNPDEYLNGARQNGHEHAVLPDVYQDGLSAGSLVKARSAWIHLDDGDVLHVPQRFGFAFDCPSSRMARGLAAFVRYAWFTGVVHILPGGRIPDPARPWQVTGSTRPTVWSLPHLEHLFMRLREAGQRYDSTLVALDLIPAAYDE